MLTLDGCTCRIKQMAKLTIKEEINKKILNIIKLLNGKKQSKIIMQQLKIRREKIRLI